MTYEEWREINIPEWRKVPCNGWNDPNEGWHYHYRQEFPNWTELSKPKPKLPENRTTDEATIQELIAAINNKPKNVFIDIPHEIIEAAEKIHLWFAERGIENWQLGHVQNRR